MEEKVKFEKRPPIEEKPQTPSYEELVNQLKLYQNDNNKLREIATEMNNLLQSKRLDYLFKVLEFALNFDDDTVSKTVGEIKVSLFPKEEDSNESEN